MLKNNQGGFSLIELLIVMAIIITLCAGGFLTYDWYTYRANVAKAQSELTSLRNAVLNMTNDTGRWPLGCIPGHALSNTESGSCNEIPLNDKQAGLGMTSDCGSECGNNKLCTPSYDDKYCGLAGGGSSSHNSCATDSDCTVAGETCIPNPSPRSNCATGCGWPPAALGSCLGYTGWRGPYATGSGLDPWGHPYWFDNDYRIGFNCPTSPYRTTALGGTATSTNDVGLIAALVSLGPDGNNSSPNVGASQNNVTSSDCDDIFVELPSDHGAQVN